MVTSNLSRVFHLNFFLDNIDYSSLPPHVRAEIDRQVIYSEAFVLYNYILWYVVYGTVIKVGQCFRRKGGRFDLNHQGTAQYWLRIFNAFLHFLRVYKRISWALSCAYILYQ